jgi:hypothetical protein
LALAAAFLGAADPAGSHLDNGRAYLALPNHEAPLVYRFGDVPFKPYIETLTTPSGINILRDAPADHLHHHGLMFAVRVDNVNFWEEKDTPGIERINGPVQVKSPGRTRHILTGTVDWIDPKVDKPVLIEHRTIELYQDGDLDYTLATWQSSFLLPEGKTDATLTGTEYNGLGMRFLQSMDTGGRFFNADGVEGVEGTNQAASKWCAYTAQADGKPVTVAMFAHPGNPRPVKWYTMNTPFAYLSATLGLKSEPLVINAPSPLTLRYGVAVWDGETKPKDIDKAYERWLKIVDDPSWRTVQ